MTIEDLMDKEGFLVHGRKCRCPSGTHQDNNPSAIINDDSVYCFSCHRRYGKKWLESKFNVRFDAESSFEHRKLIKEILFMEV